ncbi:leukocyte immunoglobulin-like receptor subfamily A member 3 [Acomys russatus]|uniref:leukocyte immunoglobulin-like receptor subfamily A member 3 n=1 Tax=Acomys russatus TaxID=60746 RepID=UPI0021E1FD52|nr:leukocyte immunoglobulin-like receptor subfamily A member 3 [Acomys russatus]
MGFGAAFLGFVCLIEQRIWAHDGPLPQPSIWAVPGTVISKGSAVTIFCRTPPGVTTVCLFHNISERECHDSTSQASQEVSGFILQSMIHTDVGIYSCQYNKGDGSSESDKLELMVTGVYEEKPSLTVDSDHQGLSEMNVTLLCHPPHFFDTFILCGDGNASFPQNCSHQDHKTFIISPVSPVDRRTYRCFGSYKSNSYLWSLPSDPLEFPIPGPLPQPSIWAVPGTVISKGSDVTIFCRTPPGVTRVCLSNYVSNKDWHDCTPQGSQEVYEFILHNMIHTNAGIYYCEYNKGGEWSQISNKLELMVTGVFEEKPSLTVDSGPQGLSETNVTLLCHPPRFFDTFILCRDGKASFPQNCSHQDHKTFIIAPVSSGHRTTYRCFGSYKENSYLWSLPSDPFELPIPGKYHCKPGQPQHSSDDGNRIQGFVYIRVFSLSGGYQDKPSLTVDSGSQGLSETNVTLLCHPPHSFDTFILCKDGNASFPKNCSHQDHKTFIISPVSPRHRRTYRCFGSFKSNSYLWSLPSDPIELPIPDPSGPIAVWASVAAACFLVFLLIFICLCCYWAKCRTTNGETKRQVKYRRSSPAVDMDEKNKYDDFEGIRPENCSPVDTQASAAEDSQEVTYAQLNREIVKRNMDSLPSNTLPGMSTQTCVYATLMLSQEKSQS